MAFETSPMIVPSGHAPLPRAKPEEMGVSATGVLAFINDINVRVHGLHGMMLLRYGHVIAEAWWAPYRADRRHLLWSLSKSFTSTGIGFAAAEGLLSVEDKVISFFPDAAPKTISENLAAMRVKDLLSMSAGHEAAPALSHDDDWVRAFLGAEVPRRPGTLFAYSSPATFVLSAIVQKLTGQRLTQYLTPRLFEPLGITDFHSEQSPLGIDIGGYGLSVRLEDIAKFGQLYLQRGEWNGRQLLPAAWIDEATSAHVSNGDPLTGKDWSQGYGYQFWRCRHGCYRGDGAFGQYCVVMPAWDAVLAIFSNVADLQAVLDLAWEHLFPAMEAGGSEGPAIPPQAVPMPAGKSNSPIAAQVSGKRWHLEPNDDGIEAVSLTFTPERCLLDVFTKKRRYTIPAGLSDWLDAVHHHEGAPRAIASRGVWESENTFTLKICFTERPDDWSQTFIFDGDRLTVTRRQMRFGFAEGSRTDLSGTRGE